MTTTHGNHDLQEIPLGALATNGRPGIYLHCRTCRLTSPNPARPLDAPLPDPMVMSASRFD